MCDPSNSGSSKIRKEEGRRERGKERGMKEGKKGGQSVESVSKIQNFK